MDKFNTELDEYYIACISNLLMIQEEADQLIRFWENKRKELRRDNVRKN